MEIKQLIDFCLVLMVSSTVLFVLFMRAGMGDGDGEDKVELSLIAMKRTKC